MIKSSNVPMFQCSNVQIFKCSNVQMFKCSNVLMFKCSNVQIFKCSYFSYIFFGFWEQVCFSPCNKKSLFLGASLPFIFQFQRISVFGRGSIPFFLFSPDFCFWGASFLFIFHNFFVFEIKYDFPPAIKKSKDFCFWERVFLLYAVQLLTAGDQENVSIHSVKVASDKSPCAKSEIFIFIKRFQEPRSHRAEELFFGGGAGRGRPRDWACLHRHGWRLHQGEANYLLMESMLREPQKST